MLRPKFVGIFPFKLCGFGCITEETQEHQLNCKYLIQEQEDPSIFAGKENGYIFGSLEAMCFGNGRYRAYMKHPTADHSSR